MEAFPQLVVSQLARECFLNIGAACGLTPKGLCQAAKQGAFLILIHSCSYCPPPPNPYLEPCPFRLLGFWTDRVPQGALTPTYHGSLLPYSLLSAGVTVHSWFPPQQAALTPPHWPFCVGPSQPTSPSAGLHGCAVPREHMCPAHSCSVNISEYPGYKIHITRKWQPSLAVPLAPSDLPHCTCRLCPSLSDSTILTKTIWGCWAP